MKIKYYGHACFKIEGKSYDIAIDPYDETIGLGKLRIDADILLISHEHYDHNYRQGVILKNNNINNEYMECVQIVESYHDKEMGKLRGKNKIHVIDMEEKRICHLGDLGHLLTDEMIEELGKVDVLMIPVGGKYTIDAEEAVRVIKQVKANIVIPMHYRVDNSMINVDSVDNFLNKVQGYAKVFKVQNNELKITDDMESGIYILM